MPKPFKRTGLHRLECEACPGYVYATVAALEAHGLPRCGCGARVMPARLELGLLLGLRDGIVADYHERVAGFQRGQHASYTRKGHAGSRSGLDAVADEFDAEYRSRARERRLIGLGIREVSIKGGRGAVERYAASNPDEIPF